MGLLFCTHDIVFVKTAQSIYWNAPVFLDGNEIWKIVWVYESGLVNIIVSTAFGFDPNLKTDCLNTRIILMQTVLFTVTTVLISVTVILAHSCTSNIGSSNGIAVVESGILQREYKSFFKQHLCKFTHSWTVSKPIGYTSLYMYIYISIKVPILLNFGEIEIDLQCEVAYTSKSDQATTRRTNIFRFHRTEKHIFNPDRTIQQMKLLRIRDKFSCRTVLSLRCCKFSVRKESDQIRNSETIVGSGTCTTILIVRTSGREEVRCFFTGWDKSVSILMKSLWHALTCWEIVISMNSYLGMLLQQDKK